MKPPGVWVSTYIVRRPSGAWRTNGPPAVSAVVWGWGRPATVPAMALPGVVMCCPRSCDRDDCLANGVHHRARRPDGQLLAAPGLDGGPGRPEQHVNHDDQLENPPGRHARPCPYGHGLGAMLTRSSLPWLTTRANDLRRRGGFVPQSAPWQPTRATP